VWAVAGSGMLGIVLIHLATGHSLLRTGHQTEHMRRHQQRSGPVRLAVNVAWLVWMISAVALIFL